MSFGLEIVQMLDTSNDFKHHQAIPQISPSSDSAGVVSTIWTSFLSWRFFACLDAFLRCFSSKITDARIDNWTP